MPQKAIHALVRFARVVSDADVAQRDVPLLLADALLEHVRPDAVAIYVLDANAKLELAAEHGVPELASSELHLDLDDVTNIGEVVRAACGERFAAQVSRPMVAGANLFGAAVLLYTAASTIPMDSEHLPDLIEGLIDLAALSLETSVHVDQLERQYAELHEQQEMLIRSEKLRALGQMAAGVSHDLKNILNPLSLHIQVITRGLDRGKIDDAKESAVEMKQVLQRGLQTLERLRDFSRQSNVSKTELVDIDRLAREAAAIGKARAASSGGGLPKIREELHSPSAVMAISGEIISALVNLVVNAVDAMAGRSAGGGTITLRSGEDDKGVWIEVADDGPGMPREVAKHIFEPFFTTKGQEGTGLGLAMVYATMQRHGGTATVATEPGKGTTFRLSLPLDGPMSHGAIRTHA